VLCDAHSTTPLDTDGYASRMRSTNSAFRPCPKHRSSKTHVAGARDKMSVSHEFRSVSNLAGGTCRRSLSALKLLL
jgi:hypothetical protein